MTKAGSDENFEGQKTVLRLSQLVAYDERLRTDQSQTAQDEELETLAPELTKAMRALRDALRFQSPNDLLAANRDAESLDTRAMSENSTPTGPITDELAAEPLVPDRFELIAKLGSGGFGIVYQAYDTWLKRHVAIKFLRPELLSNATLRQRFLRESRAAARLNHPFIVRVLEVSEAAGSTWQVCELVEGAPLSEHISVGALQPSIAARLTRDLADAVAHAHTSSVLHRDIKPDNIMVDRQAGESLETATLRLTDFGLARLTDIDATLLSHTGMLVGTPRYMAPEQLSGKVDEHGVGTDIYAIGIVLYELLSGQSPFGQSSSLQERLAKLHHPITYVGKLSPQVPRDLATICHKCLEYRPDRRYLSAAELREDLDRFLRGDPTQARPLPLHEHLWRWSMRHRTSASVLCILIVMTGLILALTLRNNSTYRWQNTQLSKVNEELTKQEHHARELANLADKLREEAIGKQERFVDLAWKKGIREAYTAWHERNYAEASELLASLSESHLDAVSRVEWRLLRTDIDRQVKLLLDLPCTIHEVRAIPNSHRVAAAAADGTLYIVDIITGKLTGQISTGIRSLHALAISPDGQLAAVGGSPSMIPNWSFPKIYNLDTLQLVTQLPGQVTTIESLEFSTDGKRLACGCRYSTVKIFTLDSEDSDQAIELPTERRNTWLSASPTGGSFAAQGGLNSVVISDPHGGNEHQQVEFPYHVACTSWLPSGKALILASRHAEKLSIKTNETPPRNFALGGVSSTAEPYALTTSGELLAASSLTGQVLIWRDEPQVSGEQIQPLATWQLSTSPIYSVAILDNRLIAASHDGELISALIPKLNARSSTSDTQPRDTVSLDGQLCRTLMLASEGEYAVIGKSNGEVRRIQLESEQGALIPSQPVQSQLYTRQNISINDDEGQLTLMTRPLRESGQPFDMVTGIEVASDHRMWAFCRNTLLEVFGKPPGAPDPPVLFRVSVPYKDAIGCLAFSPDASRLAWTGSDAKVHVVPLTDAEPAVISTRLKGQGGCLAWSPRGDRLALSGQLPILEFDPDKNELTEIVDYGLNALCLVYNRQGRIVSGHRDGTVRFVDPDSRRTHVLNLHPVDVRSLLLIDDQRIGLSFDIDANIGVWFADGEHIGLIKHEPLGGTDVQSVSPQAWTDTHSTLKVLYSDRDGYLFLDTWNIRQR